MKTCSLFAAIAVLWVSAVAAQPKSYAIQSLEGIPQTISITDLGHETAIVNCEKSKLVIRNFWSLDTITVESQKFLKIKYAVRGGSDLSLQNTLLLAVSKQSIIAPFFVFSREISSLKAIDSGTDTVLFDEKTFYQVRLSLSGNSTNNYKLLANVTDISKSKVEPKNNYKQHRQVVYKFDKNSQVFCNNYTLLNKRFKIIENRYPLKSSMKTVKGTFPSVVIKEPRGHDATNYYIDGRWYEKGERNRLVACY